MNCRSCKRFIVATLDEWAPGACPHCGFWPPLDLPDEYLAQVIREHHAKVTRFGGGFSSNR